MTEFMATITDFFFAHSVAICVILGILLVLSSVLFLKVMSKRKKKVSESKYSNNPEIDELEKMYLDSLKS